MAPALQNGKKRKAVVEEELQPQPFATNVGLEMESEDEEAGAEDSSDDGEVDEFPEIDTRSDSEEEDSGEEVAESEEDEEDEEDEEEDRKSTRLNSSHSGESRMPSSA